MLCAIAKIDSTATERLAKLAKLSERFGIPPKHVYGHITLATYLGHDEEQFISSCKEILKGYRKYSVYYDKIEIWTPPPFIVAVPQAEKTMDAIQKAISTRWAADLNEWTQEDIWCPHTSLLFNPEADFGAIAKVMQEAFEAFTAQIEKIEFSRLNKNDFEIVDAIELR